MSVASASAGTSALPGIPSVPASAIPCQRLSSHRHGEVEAARLRGTAGHALRGTAGHALRGTTGHAFRGTAEGQEAAMTGPLSPGTQCRNMSATDGTRCHKEARMSEHAAAVPVLPAAAAGGQPEPARPAGQAGDETLATGELLVEEVSIDGMCGVY